MLNKGENVVRTVKFLDAFLKNVTGRNKNKAPKVLRHMTSVDLKRYLSEKKKKKKKSKKWIEGKQ
jgi:hypothetical protein